MRPAVCARQSYSGVANSARKAHHSLIDVARPPRRERVVLAPSRGTRRPAGSAPARTHQDGGVVGRRSPAHGAGEECHQHEPQVSHTVRAHGLMQCRGCLGRALLPNAERC